MRFLESIKSSISSLLANRGRLILGIVSIKYRRSYLNECYGTL